MIKLWEYLWQYYKWLFYIGEYPLPFGWTEKVVGWEQGHMAEYNKALEAGGLEKAFHIYKTYWGTLRIYGKSYFPEEKYVLMGFPTTRSFWKRFWNWWWHKSGTLKRYSTHFYKVVEVSLCELDELSRKNCPFGRKYWWDWSGNSLEFGRELAIIYNKIRGTDRI